MGVSIRKSPNGVRSERKSPQRASFRPELGQRVFKSAVEIYEASFPKNERQPTNVIVERILSRKEILYLGRVKGEVVLAALVFPLEGTDFLLLDYVAVKKQHRGRGIGRQFLSFLLDLLKHSSKRFVFELEDPALGRNKSQRRRRISLYREFGAKQLAGVSYILPKLSGSRTTKMVMMIMPCREETTLSGELVRTLLTTIYRDVYNLDSGDPLVKSTLSTVGEMVEVV